MTLTSQKELVALVSKCLPITLDEDDLWQFNECRTPELFVEMVRKLNVDDIDEKATEKLLASSELVASLDGVSVMATPASVTLSPDTDGVWSLNKSTPFSTVVSQKVQYNRSLSAPAFDIYPLQTFYVNLVHGRKRCRMPFAYYCWRVNVYKNSIRAIA
jgi:hypothetical protein